MKFRWVGGPAQCLPYNKPPQMLACMIIITICPFVLECFGLFISSSSSGCTLRSRSHAVSQTAWPETQAPHCYSVSSPLPALPPLCPPDLSECQELWRKPVWLQPKFSLGSSNTFRAIWHDFMEVSLRGISNVKHNLVLETWKKKPSDFFSSTFPLYSLSSLSPPFSGVITPQWGPEVMQQR